MSDHLDLVMFGALMAAILSGFPVSLSIAGIAVIFSYLGWMLGEMNISLLGAILFGIATPTEAASVGAIGALLMAGRRIGLNPRLIVFEAGALIVLALLAGAFPVRLQRSDAGPADWALGGLYAALAAGGLVAVVLALRAGIRTGIIQEALTSTLTMPR